MDTQTFVFGCEPPVAEPGFNTGGTHAVVSEQARVLKRRGYNVEILTLELLSRVPKRHTPYSYISEILDRLVQRGVAGINLATDFRMGFLIRRWCLARGYPFTTFFHTRYPELLKIDLGIPTPIGLSYMRWFHAPSACVLAPTPSMAAKLQEYGVRNAVACPHGVDIERFKPGNKGALDHLGCDRPYYLCVSRITDAKSIRDFVALEPIDNNGRKGAKFVVGDGPLIGELSRDHPDDHFLGIKRGPELAAIYDAADVFVLPSRLETGSCVLLEAAASGVPSVATPVEGPVSVLTDPEAGCLDYDLQRGALRALQLDPANCRRFGEQQSWDRKVDAFMSHQVPILPTRRGRFRIGCERRFNLPARLMEPVVGRTHYHLFEKEKR